MTRFFSTTILFLASLTNLLPHYSLGWLCFCHGNNNQRNGRKVRKNFLTLNKNTRWRILGLSWGGLGFSAKASINSVYSVAVKGSPSTGDRPSRIISVRKISSGISSGGGKVGDWAQPGSKEKTMGLEVDNRSNRAQCPGLLHRGCSNRPEATITTLFPYLKRTLLWSQLVSKLGQLATNQRNSNILAMGFGTPTMDLSKRFRGGKGNFLLIILTAPMS